MKTPKSPKYTINPFKWKKRTFIDRTTKLKMQKLVLITPVVKYVIMQYGCPDSELWTVIIRYDGAIRKVRLKGIAGSVMKQMDKDLADKIESMVSKLSDTITYQ